MIKVYFESEQTADLVAVFSDEETYAACLPALKKEADKHGLKITESVVDYFLEGIMNDYN